MLCERRNIHRSARAGLDFLGRRARTAAAEVSLEDFAAPTMFLAGRPFLVGLMHIVIAGAVTVHTLTHKREVPAAIAWIGIAWFTPILGALLYVGFGINRVKRRARRLKGPVEDFDAPLTGDISSTDPMERLKVAVGNITGQQMAAGKVIAVLECGDQGYPQMLAAIAAAKSSIRLTTFIFRTDEVGMQFVDALVAAHRRGVKVRVLIDGFGGGFLRSSAYHRLHGQGVPAARFLHSLLPWKMPFLDLRLHKKILVLDGVTAFVGGLNIAAENVLARRPKSPVRDLHFHVEGTIVQQIEQEFDDDWSFTTGEAPTEVASPPDTNAGVPARAIGSGPDQEVDQLVLVLLSAIGAARRSIRIATPYFLPDEQLLTALQLATLRGVDVQIVLPGINNHRLVAWAAEAHIRPLLQTGCHLWRSSPPFDHSKLMTIDGEWCLVGSANWDTRSLRLNFELTVEFYDSRLADRLAGIIDKHRNRPITLEEIDKRPLIWKLRDAAARLAMPYI
jgi:cardiolipin synthase A/B